MWKCKFGFHQWSVWESVKLRVTVDLPVDSYNAEGQKRHCLRCGKIKIKEV